MEFTIKAALAQDFFRNRQALVRTVLADRRLGQKHFDQNLVIGLPLEIAVGLIQHVHGFGIGQIRIQLSCLVQFVFT